MAVSDDAFDHLFRSEYPAVVRAVEWTVGSRAIAEEITQDAFCRALERWRRVRNHENPAAWVQLTALRMAVRADRRRRRGDETQPGWSSAGETRPADVDLQRAIGELSDGQRHAVVLHHLLDLPVAQVAELMRVSEGTVKTHLHRGRARLASALREDEEIN